MSIIETPPSLVPWWTRAAIIIAALPVLAYPWMLAAAREANAGVDTWLWFYPVYVLFSASCEWRSASRRPEVTWILVVLMLLTHAAMWVLVLNPGDAAGMDAVTLNTQYN